MLGVRGGLVDFGLNPSTIHQGEMFEGEFIDVTLQLQMDPNDHIGTTGYPFNIYSWLSTRGAVDNNDVERDTFSVFIPCTHVASSPILKDKRFYPRLDENKSSIIVYIRGKLKRITLCSGFQIL